MIHEFYYFLWEPFLRFPISYPKKVKVFRSMPDRVRSVVAGVILPGVEQIGWSYIHETQSGVG